MTNQKKIVFIQHYGSIGGSGVSLLNTVLVLNKHFDVTVYCPSTPNTLGNLLESKKIQVKYYDFNCGQLAYYSGGLSWYRYAFWKSFVSGLFQLSKWKKILLTEHPDIVMVNSKVLVYLGLILKNYTSVCFIRETIPKHKNLVINAFQNYLLSKFNIVSFLSKYDANCTKISKSIKIVAHDFSMEDLKEIKNDKRIISNKNFKILFVGGSDPIKGLDVLLKAMLILKNENVILSIAGNIVKKVSFKRNLIGLFKEGTYLLNNLTKYIDKNNLQDKVEFIGVKEELNEYFDDTDVLIVPMNVAHQSRPAFEIGFYSKPVIISSFENINEFFIDQINCLRFDHKNPLELANKILHLKNDVELLEKLGVNNYEMSSRLHVSSTLNELIEKVKEQCTI